MGIQRLSIACCRQATITDTAFAHLRGIQLLNMSNCRQFTDAAFEHLRGIHTLYMWCCDQSAITDAAFVHLRGIHTLVLAYCSQDAIAGATFANLNGAALLAMCGCSCHCRCAGPGIARAHRARPVRRFQVCAPVRSSESAVTLPLKRGLTFGRAVCGYRG